MESLIAFIVAHESQAPWMAFSLMLLAGLNIPVSIDAILIACAFISATIVPEATYPLLAASLFGTYFAAWISYWFGRLLGPKITKLPLLRKLLTEDKLLKMRAFYSKRGFVTLLAGRFIPFGVRNCLFISTGMSRAPFFQFALRDLFATTLWATTMFTIFYHLSTNYELLIRLVKTFNIAIFSLVGVTLISIIWYKRRKQQKQNDQPVE